MDDERLMEFFKSLSREIGQLKNEMITRFDGMDRRFERIEERLDGVETNTTGMLMQIGGINRSLTASVKERNGKPEPQ